MQTDNPWSSLPSTNNVDASSQQPSGRLRDEGDFPGLKHGTENQKRQVSFWGRLTGECPETVGWKQSIIALATYSWLNALLFMVPVAWAVRFAHHVPHQVTFAVSLVAMLPLVKLLHFAGDQMALICGRVAGDLAIITVNNSLETVMAIILLLKCELRLLHSTITGFVLLRLLFISGVSFVTGGVRRKNQVIHAHRSQLNQTMLMTGALTLLLPALFYYSVDRSPQFMSEGVNVTDSTNELLNRQLLVVSRALSPLLLVAYVCSFCYLHYPPGGGDAPSEKDPETCAEHHGAPIVEEKPKVNFWVSLMTMTVVGVLISITGEGLISSIQPMKASVQEEWFGLVLMPLISFTADGLLMAVYIIRSQFQRWLGTPSRPAGSLAETRAIDLSIQFMLFWTPVLVLIGWIFDEPMSLLFGLFEVLLLISTCFLLNCVTLDSKTNWAGGAMLVIFYLMVIITTWFYPGRHDMADTCHVHVP